MEQVYSFIAPITATYSIVVTSASGWVDYGWRASSCAETGWTCIDDINSTGTKGSMSWTAGTVYYILLDDENSMTGTHQFYVINSTTGIADIDFINNLTIHPNPNTGKLTLEMELTKSEDFEIKVVNTFGQSVFVEQVTAPSGKYEKHIDLSNFAKGVYMLQLISNEAMIKYQVVLQ